MGLGGSRVSILLTVVVLTTVSFVAVGVASPGAVDGSTEADSQPTATPGATEDTQAGVTEAAPATNTESAPVADESPSNLSDAPPVVKKYHAADQIEGIDATDANEKQVERAHDRIDGSLKAYRGPRRVGDSSAFNDDAVAVRSLAHLHDSEAHAAAKRATALTYEADNESAHVAVADARRALDRYGDDMDNQALRRSAERHLDTAEESLERADRTAADDADGWAYYQSRAQAITELRTAHRHAHMVVDFVDRETDPDVRAELATDPVSDGNKTAA